MTFDDHLTPEQNDVKWAIIDRIIAAGLVPHFFFPYIPDKYDGKVIAAAAISGHPLLQAASVKAAREALFGPLKMNGQPVRVTGVIRYTFKLSN